MTLMETAQLIGNFGEGIGALGVVITLFYLAVQVRHSKTSVDANTRALEENRKVRRAEAYQSRLHNMSENSRLIASSESLTDILVRMRVAGFPAPESLDSLQPVERERARSWITLQYLNIENLHYQYELGLIEPDFYQEVVVERIKDLGRLWKDVGFIGSLGRPRFHAEIERVLNLKGTPENHA